MPALLADQTYDALLKMILERKVKPGDRLPSELVLCEELHVSRNTLRAALNKLSALGITETRQGGGTFVRTADSRVYLNFFLPATLTHNWDLLEVMEFRKGIEVEATYLAAQYATEEDVAELRKLLNEFKIDDLDSYAEKNNEFHHAIVRASHNKLYEGMMRIVRTMILPEMREFQKSQESVLDSPFYHAAILECIAAHKPDEAAFLMSKHLAQEVERIRHYVEQSEAEDPKNEK